MVIKLDEPTGPIVLDEPASPVVLDEKPEEDVSVFADIAQGVGAGIIGVPQGIAETVAAGVDLALDTDFSRDVTGAANAVKDYLGFTPETTAGQAAEAITTFGSVLIPFVGWTSRASQAANAAKVLPTTSRLKKSADVFGKSKIGKSIFKGDTAFSRRARLAAGTSLGGGAIEMLVAPDGTHTLADAFEVLPTSLQTESDTGLQGRDEAGRRIRNKLRMFPESVGVGLAFEAAFPVAKGVAKGVSYVPGVPASARLVTKGFDLMADKASTAFNGKLKKYFATTGELDRELLENLRTTTDVTEGQINRAEELLQSFQKDAYKVVGGLGLLGRGKEGVQKTMDDLLLYLEGDVNALKAYKKPEVEAAAKRMRQSVDELTDDTMREIEFAIEGGYGNKDILEEALMQMEMSKGKYLRRLFEGAFSLETKELNALKGTTKFKEATKDLAKFLDKDLDEATRLAQAEAELTRMLGKKTLDLGVDPAEALRMEKKALSLGQTQTNSAPLYKLADGMFKKRSKYLDKSPAVRELMKEIRDPQQLFMTTVSDLVRFNASSQLYRSIAANAKTLPSAIEEINRGGRPFVISGKDVAPDEASKLVTDYGYEFIPAKKLVAEEGEELVEGAVDDTIFSSDYGALGGTFVAKELKNAITIPARNDNILNDLLSLSLIAKGVSQMNVTVLNLAGQARNFASGAFMVGANGNFARTMGLGETFDAVFKKTVGTTDDEMLAFRTMIGDLGLVDDNLAVSEYKKLLQETDGLRTQKVGEAVNSIINSVPLVKPLQSLYSNTDTYWKTVGFVGEKAKFSSAFRNAGINPENLAPLADDLVSSGLIPRASEITGKYDVLDVMSADIVKETMPMYSRTPMIVQKVLRRIPMFGSFTAFPAEVIRNTANIVRRGTRELGFTAPKSLVDKIGPESAAKLERQIRAIGANRLMSYVSSAVVIPTAMARASYKMTGVEEEQVDQMKVGMADWMQGSQLVSLSPITKDKGWEHFNLSYIMPYDFALAPARAALEKYEQNGKLGVGEAENITASLWNGFTKFMDPFASEAMFAERVLDTLPPGYGGRGGKTVVGGDVYLDSQDVGTKLAKSFRHVGDAFTPNMVQLFADVRPEGVKQGPLVRAVTGDPTNRGKTTDIYTELLALSGVRPLTYKPQESLSFAGYRTTELRSQTIRDFARVAQANDSTKEDVLNAYDRTNADAFRHQREMYGFVKAAEAAGLEFNDIFKALKFNSNLGDEELTYVINGIFRPVNVSDKLVQNVFKETYIDKQTRKLDMLPLAELYTRGAKFNGKSLEDPSLFAERPAPIVLDEPQPAQQPAPSNVIVLDEQPATTPAPATPPSNLGAPQQRRDLSLLGSNPIDILKNQQISQRQQ